MAATSQLEELRRDVLAYAERRKGRIYAPIAHGAFRDIPYKHGPERWELIARHLPPDAKTALDIGSHWGYLAHKLEDAGLEVVAVEKNPNHLDFLQRIKAVCNKRFEVFPQSVFDLPGEAVRFDVVIALNIFHHFIKEPRVYLEFVYFLGQLECDVMFFQAHNPAEGQMEGAYRNFAPREFADFVADKAGLGSIEEIGKVRKRPVFAIRR